jgi:hypothetical protein
MHSPDKVRKMATDQTNASIRLEKISHERAKRVEWLGIRDDFRNWLLTAA